MRMMAFRIGLCTLSAAAFASAVCAKETPAVIAVRRSERKRVRVDGKISDGEYASVYKARGPAQGFEVHFARFGNSLFVAVRSRHTGWLSAGFGSKRMRASHMVIGWLGNKGPGIVEEHRGKRFFHRHGKAKLGTVTEHAISAVAGGRVLEFCLPLRHVIRGATDQGIPVIAAFRKKSKGLGGKHDFQTTMYLRLE